MRSEKKLARVTGILYLIIFFANIFVFFFVSGALNVPGDASATAQNIMASESLYRMGIASYLAVFLSDIGVAVLLYLLLRPVNQALALIAMVMRLAQSIIHGVNLLNYIFPLLLFDGAGYLAVFSPEQLEALVLLFTEAHHTGVLISEAFFAVSMFILAYLVYQSPLFPRILGVLLVFPALSYLLDSFGIFLFPDYAAVIAQVIILPTVIGELSFTLYLLVKGVRAPQAEIGETAQITPAERLTA